MPRPAIRIVIADRVDEYPAARVAASPEHRMRGRAQMAVMPHRALCAPSTVGRPLSRIPGRKNGWLQSRQIAAPLEAVPRLERNNCPVKPR
jgi:hypothetical protein